MAKVALRKESVDRNICPTRLRPTVATVALRKESVDRNTGDGCRDRQRQVALRKESVDRNLNCQNFLGMVIPSLSARRAWIEMWTSWWTTGRKPSLSARRAWIEMSVGLSYFYIIKMSLSARRAWIEM